MPAGDKFGFANFGAGGGEFAFFFVGEPFSFGSGSSARFFEAGWLRTSVKGEPFVGLGFDCFTGVVGSFLMAGLFGFGARGHSLPAEFGSGAGLVVLGRLRDVASG